MPTFRRFTLVSLAILPFVVAACGDDTSGTTHDAAVGGDASVETSDMAGVACAPGASCIAVEKSCIGLIENKGLSKYGLRLSELDVTKPDALTRGLVKTSIAAALAPDVPTCNLHGAATFNWLLQFDGTAGTLRSGGAKPVSDPTTGYAFDDEMITQGATTFHVQPATWSGITVDGSGHFSTSPGMDLVMPVFLDATGSTYILMPLHQVHLDGLLSSDQDCVGSYNAAGLDPTNSCLADDTHPAFLDGGRLSSYITLEEADTVDISALQESLCVLLSGDAATYGDGGRPTTRCKRDAGNNILFQGDWCSSTNMAAGGGCADAVTLAGNFAASSVLINN